MIQRVITLPGGRQVTLGEYVRSWKALKHLPPDTTIERWSWSHNDAAHILRAIHAGIHDRINRHVPGYGQGRKWSAEWWWPAWRMARDVNTPRLVVHATSVPFEFRARLAHRLDAGIDY